MTAGDHRFSWTLFCSNSANITTTITFSVPVFMLNQLKSSTRATAGCVAVMRPNELAETSRAGLLLI